MNTKILLISLIISLIISCKKDKNKNPFDNWKNEDKGNAIDDINIDPNSIQGLHKNIFKPTCSNSGCHDGNFEPDFRTIESSYNTLLFRLATNYDPNNSNIKFRVDPNNTDESMLLHRILNFIPGTQGKMPLTVDPGSDWPTLKEDYIQNIKNWINEGCKDQFGNLPSAQDFEPQLGGMIVFADGSNTPLPRSGFNPIMIPSGTQNIKIMFAYLDDKTPVSSFGATTANFSLIPGKYENPEKSVTKETSAFSSKGFNLPAIDYWHSITIPISDLGVTNDLIWIRTTTTDNVNSNTLIPSTLASFNAKKHYAIRIN